MNRTMIAAAIISLALPLAGLAQSPAQPASLSAPMWAHDTRTLMKSANSKAQYQRLATYFYQQEVHYRAEAAAEKIERNRRAQVNAGMMQKYPRPVDSAQYLYQSYLSQADKAALQAHHYDLLAGPPAEQTTDSQ